MSSANTLKQRNSMTIIILSLENSHLLQVNIIPLVTEQVYLWLLWRSTKFVMICLKCFAQVSSWAQLASYMRQQQQQQQLCRAAMAWGELKRSILTRDLCQLLITNGSPVNNHPDCSSLMTLIIMGWCSFTL